MDLSSQVTSLKSHVSYHFSSFHILNKAMCVGRVPEDISLVSIDVFHVRVQKPAQKLSYQSDTHFTNHTDRLDAASARCAVFVARRSVS
jgi:hypothetical protein